MGIRHVWKTISRFISRRFHQTSGRLPDADIKPFVDRIIADGILLNEIPSPSELEEVRGDFIKQKLLDFGIDDIHTDRIGNVFALFPGTGPSERYLLLYTDMDNLKYSTQESIVEIRGERLLGVGIGDNSLGAATLLVLCEYLKTQGITFDFNLIALFSLRNVPENGFEGIRTFIEAWQERIFGSVYFFGLQLGRMALDSYGICNISFTLKSGNVDALGKNYTDSTVDLAALMYNRINRVDWSAYNAIVNIVRVSSGIGFEYFPSEGTFDLEIFSKDSGALERAKNEILAIAREISQHRHFTIENSTLFSLPPADDQRNEVFNEIIRKVHGLLHIETSPTQIPDYATILNQFDIPSVTLGISTGRKFVDDEYVETGKIMTGFKQVILFLEELNQVNERPW
jgi:tripeptide aminopeptidase